METKKIDDSKVDEIIIQAEEKEGIKIHHGEKADAGKFQKIKKAGDKIGLILVFVLLLLSVIQSAELIALSSQIKKGQFSAQSAATPPAGGGSQTLPSQQGGC